MEERYIAIGIVVPKNITFDSRIREAINPDILFDPSEAKLIGLRFDDFRRIVFVGLYNPKFKALEECEIVPHYTLEQAKEKFPFLFRN